MDWDFDLWAALEADAAQADAAQAPLAWHRGAVTEALLCIAAEVACYARALRDAPDSQARFSAQEAFERVLKACARQCRDAAGEVGSHYYGDGALDYSPERRAKRTEGNVVAEASALRVRAFARFLEYTECRWYGALDPVAPQRRAWEQGAERWAAAMRA